MKAKRQEEILHEWLQAHRGVLFKVIRAYARDRDEQADLFQEISIQLWNSIPKFEEKCAVTTWVYRVALNVSLRWVKKEQRHRTDPLPGHASALTYTDEEEDPRIAWLYAQIRTLDQVDRSLALLLLDGYSYKEMSEIVGVSESNVGVKIHRIKKSLTRQAAKLVNHEY